MNYLYKVVFVFCAIECLHRTQVLGNVVITADDEDVDKVFDDTITGHDGKKHLSIAEDTDVTLFCKSTPEADGKIDQVEWFFNGHEIATSDNIKITSDETDNDDIDDDNTKDDTNYVSHLTIKDIKISQAGVYKCSNKDKTAALVSTETDEVVIQVAQVSSAMSLSISSLLMSSVVGFLYYLLQ